MRNLPAHDTNPLPPARPRQDPSPYFPNADAMRAQAEWQAHVDAGRIGTRTSIPPEILAQMEANERLLKRVLPVRG
ncbi:MAG: hypothetical protein ACX930_03710 [Erythrobacter sp.]